MTRLTRFLSLAAALCLLGQGAVARCEDHVPQPKPQNASRDIVGQDLDQIQERGFMTFAAYEDFPPWSYEESGKPVEPEGTPRESLARKLRKLEPQGLDAIPAEGAEFALVMVRRMPDGTLAVLGEIPDEVALVERAARKLLD